jgi:micrococcal nuclease
MAEEARFISVIDGDSLVVEVGGRSCEVRLIGIDAPEHGQEFGVQAKSHAMRLCYGRRLGLEYDREKRDRYGRTLAYVYCKGKMVNKEMVLAGLALAVEYGPNVRHQAELEEAEKKARTERRGFWLRGGLKQTPAQWRKQH